METKIEKIDRSNMRQIILDFPKQFPAGIQAVKGIRLGKKFLKPFPENLIICGMGGSGVQGDILVTFQPLNIFTHKDYYLPPQAQKKSLVICISYSGNTEETISCFREAIKRKLPLISITTGGKLGDLSEKYNVPLVKIPPPYIPPRLALGYQFGALVKILSQLKLTSKKLVQETLNLSITLQPKKSELKAKNLAKKIFKKIPLIYTPANFQEIGLIWKNNLNETAKILAFWNYFPELNHNEIMGFWKIKEKQISGEKFYVIILHELEKNQTQFLKQIKITKELIEKEGLEVELIKIEGKSKLEKIFSTLLFGYWLSYHLAIFYKVDPTPIPKITEFKARLLQKE